MRTLSILRDSRTVLTSSLFYYSFERNTAVWYVHSDVTLYLKQNHVDPQVLVPNNLPLHIMSRFYCKQVSSADWLPSCCLVSRTKLHNSLSLSLSELQELLVCNHHNLLHPARVFSTIIVHPPSSLSYKDYTHLPTYLTFYPLYKCQEECI